MQTSNVKTAMQEVIDKLPDDATWDDAIEEMRFYRAVEGGIRAAERGDFASKEEVKSAFARWGVDIGS